MYTERVAKFEVSNPYLFHQSEESDRRLFETCAHPEFFTWGGGADPEAIYNLYFILKVML
jgi:hypothetical protein